LNSESYSLIILFFSVASRWTSFVHELGGLLCASLNFVDSNVSSSAPHYSFRPQSSLPLAKNSELDNSLLRYAVLPREIVCTGLFFPFLIEFKYLVLFNSQKI